MKWNDDSATGKRGFWQIKQLPNGKTQALFAPKGSGKQETTPFAAFGSPAEARLAIELFENPDLVLPDQNAETPKSSRQTILDSGFVFNRHAGNPNFFSKSDDFGALDLIITAEGNQTEIRIQNVEKSGTRCTPVASIFTNQATQGMANQRALYITDIAVAIAIAEARQHSNGHYKTALNEMQAGIFLGNLKSHRRQDR